MCARFSIRNVPCFVNRFVWLCFYILDFGTDFNAKLLTVHTVHVLAVGIEPTTFKLFAL